MSDKKRTSISIDEDVYQFLQQPQINQSGLIQELVRQYQANNDRQVAALEMRLEHIESEIDELEDKLDRKRSERNDIKELLEESRKDVSEELEAAFEALDTVPDARLDPDNLAVENQADKLNMEPEQLLKRYRNNYRNT